MQTRPSLYRMVMSWLCSYAMVLTGVVVVHGFLVNEFVEDLVWQSLLTKELDHYVQRTATDPGYQWRDSSTFQLYGLPGRPLPAALAKLGPGVHDEFWLEGRETVVLTQHMNGISYAMVLDITELEAQEAALTGYVIALALTLVTVIWALLAWRLRRSLRPLAQLTSAISALLPDHCGQRIAVDQQASAEFQVIANALNDYLRRQEEFVERERVFNNTASHELRTPIAVIAGASELALEDPGLPATVRRQIQRIQRTARNVDQLLTLLLTLAKEPARLARDNDSVALDELLLDIIDDHSHLLQGKALSVIVDQLNPCIVNAPPRILHAAVGNLLRNAIEHSDQGDIHIRLDGDATVTIQDPGHGMTPEEISRISAQIARGGGREGGGIGLDLLARLCEHLGWTLSFVSAPGRGTVSRLCLSTCLHSERIKP